MTTLAVTAGLVAWTRRGPRQGLLVAITILAPLLTVPLVLATTAWRRRRPTPDPDVREVARLTGIALRSGHSLSRSLHHAALHSTQATSEAVEDVLRRARSAGLGPALAATSGPLGPLARRLAAAHRTGASAIGTVDAVERELTERQHAERLARVRRLPVQLTIPLVLLILPGSVLVLIGPPVIEEFARLADQWVLGP